MFLVRNVPFIRCNGVKRNFSWTSKRNSAYDNDGKTTVTVLNKSSELGVMIDSYSKIGFRLNNGMFVYGPMILFPKTALSWNVEGDQDIHEKSLQLFSVIEPKFDLVVIGYGGTPKPLDSKRLHDFRMKKKINLEILPSDKAAATFNYLCSEGRWVAGAFIPPFKVHMYESEISENILKKKESLSLDSDYL